MNNPSQSSNNSDMTILENGTMMGSITTVGSTVVGQHLNFNVPEIIISSCQSNNSLSNSLCNVIAQEERAQVNTEEAIDENTALLDTRFDEELETDELEQSLLNRSTTADEGNVLDSSFYSETPTPTADMTDVIIADAVNYSGGSTLQTHSQSHITAAVADNAVINSRPNSRESRPNKRMRGKRRKSKSKNVEQRVNSPVETPYLPQYTTIFLDVQDPATGQLTGATMPAPFVNAAATIGATDYNCQHPHLQFCQQQPSLFTTIGRAIGHQISRPLNGAPNDLASGSNGTAATTSNIAAPLRTRARKWFTRPSLPFLIGVLSLGGVACTLGGIVLGSTGLIEHSTQYLSAALLMIGIGVSLLIISGAIWRLSQPDNSDECPCHRNLETCRNCTSPYCTNRLLAGSCLYTDFQHRLPPPPYLPSLNECAALGLLYHSAAQPQQAVGIIRGNTPPPLYRSTNSLSALTPSANLVTATGTTAPLSTTSSTLAPSLPSANADSLSNCNSFTNEAAIAMNAVFNSLQVQTQNQMLKKINYLELD